MAATVSAWGKPGAWALDSEQQQQHQEEEEEDEKRKQQLFTPFHLRSTPAAQPLSEFPLLSAAVTTKTKKKKPQAVSLSEFTTASAKTNELLSLPTGPRERSAEELERSSSRIGGGFRSSDQSNSSRWGRGSDTTDEPRRNSNREPAPPSKADEVDDWGAAKKSALPLSDRRDRDRGSGSGAGFFDSHSRADESDTWLSKKTFLPSGRFDRERRGAAYAFEKDTSNAGPHSDNWLNKRGGEVSENGRPKLLLQPRSLTPTTGESAVAPNKTNPFGAARPREQVLADKGQDWKKIDEQLNDGSTTFGNRREISSNPTEKSWRKTVSEDSPPSSEVEADKDGDGVVSEN